MNEKELNVSEEVLLERLYLKKSKADLELTKVNYMLEPLLSERNKLTNEIKNIKYEICDIKGHKFDTELAYLTKKYGMVYVCEMCGKRVSENDIRDKDIMVNKTSKVLYKR